MFGFKKAPQNAQTGIDTMNHTRRDTNMTPKSMEHLGNWH